MGQGGDVVIVNGTDSQLNRTNMHSYQMNSWNFPQTIAPFSTVSVYVEFDENVFHDHGDDGGDIDYALANGQVSFHIHASFRNIKVSTKANGQNYEDNLGWNHDGKMGFVIAGTGSSQYFVQNSVSAESWMATLLPTIGNLTLRDICVPGSHDAGMSVIRNSTAFSNPGNTQTQDQSIGGQLMRGSRFFDIRPIIGGGQYYTGHYSEVNILGATTWQGSRGQSIDEIINDVNSFTNSHKEVVILQLSHDYNTDVGNESYRPFTKEEYQGLFQKLCGGLHSLYSTKADPTLLPLNALIHDRAAVIIVVDTSLDFIGNYDVHQLQSSTTTDVDNKGSVKTVPVNAQIPSSPPGFSVFNEYSGTEDVNDMMNGQLAKMANYSMVAPGTNTLFLLSWTLTLSDTHSAVGGKTIQDLANLADQNVYQNILPAANSTHHPNILYLDYYNQNAFGALAVAINCKVFHEIK